MLIKLSLKNSSCKIISNNFLSADHNKKCLGKMKIPHPIKNNIFVWHSVATITDYEKHYVFFLWYFASHCDGNQIKWIGVTI
jgi:hypothetical protein